MSDHGTAPLGRMQAWLVDGILGASMALVAITAAQAALPAHPALLSRQPATVQVAVSTAAAPKPALIAFSTPVSDAEIDSPFGLRQLPWEGAGRLHAGIDMLAQTGAPVMAAADGVITQINQDAGYGRWVEVTHAEGLTTRYAHMARIAPKLTVGMALKAGDAVGFVGSTGSSTGAHLHFEIRDSQDRPMNPEMFLGRSFADAEDLPLKDALKPAHRGVRVAYVSNIPASKRALMEAKLERLAPTQLSPAAQRKLDAETARRIAASFGDDALSAGSGPDGRPRARLNLKPAAVQVGETGALNAG